MNKALVFSVVSIIGVVVFSMAAALLIASDSNSGAPMPMDRLLLPVVLILIGLVFAVSFQINFRRYRRGR